MISGINYDRHSVSTTTSPTLAAATKNMSKHDDQVRNVAERQKIVKSSLSDDFEHIFQTPFRVEDVGTKNCENLIGSVALPLGLAGPARASMTVTALGEVSGSVSVSDTGDTQHQPELLTTVYDQEQIFLPLATTEGALVASINRGCKALTESGGAQVFVKKVGMTRAPVFECGSAAEALQLSRWFESQLSLLDGYARETSRYIRLISIQTWIRGRLLFVRFGFDTDQAMGMNMVTIATKHIWSCLQNQQNFELLEAAQKPDFSEVRLLSVSSNVCADKKPSLVNQLYGRGYSVEAEVVLPQQVLTTVLKTTPEDLLKVHHAKNIVGSSVAGSSAQNMHAANAAAALYAATGQDLAHVVEASQTATQLIKEADTIRFSVSMPAVVVGVVGGGTGIAAQAEARKLIRSGQPVSAEFLAGVVGIAVLAGEVSGLAALASHSLTQAHQRLGRDAT